jgi:hypothetical protein
MKRGTTSEERIESGNLDHVTRLGLDDPDYVKVLAFVALLAEMADAISQGDNIYMTIGANRARTALVATLNDGQNKTYAAGSSLVDLFQHAVEAF